MPKLAVAPKSYTTRWDTIDQRFGVNMAPYSLKHFKVTLKRGQGLI